nr:isocitrate dehydrogenase [NAD] subunit gamma, mitochondrial-like [Leptinotarsa decemlineata]
MASGIMKRNVFLMGQFMMRSQSTMSAFEIQHKTPLIKRSVSIIVIHYFKLASFLYKRLILGEEAGVLPFYMQSQKRNIEQWFFCRKLSDGLFLETSKKIAKEYPEIEHNEMIIDNCCMQLVSNPHQFDVMIMTNLYGSIVSNVVCGLIGGAGLLSGKNYGEHYAIFEPGTRNTGTAIAGKNIANPIAMLSASVDMLNHLGHLQHANMIKNAIVQTLCEDKIYTPDLGGTAKSTDVVQRIIDHVLMSDIRPW